MINWVCNITILILLTTVTGSVLTLTWLLLKHFLKRFVSIRFMHGVICLVLIGCYVPVVYLFMLSGRISVNNMVDIHTPVLDSIMVILFGIWLGGILIQGYMLSMEFLRIYRVKKTSIPMPLPQKEKLIASIQEQLPMKRHITVKQGYGVNSPFVSGVFFIKIYYPEVPLDDKEMRNAMLHELVHVVHLDTIWKPLGVLLGCIYWFNPLMRIVFSDLDRWSEAYCDSTCVRLLGSAKEYYEMLFSFCERIEHNNCCYLPAWVSEKSELVWRINCIRQYGRRTMHHLAVASWVGMLVALSVYTTYAATMETGKVYNALWFDTMQGERLELPPPLKVKERTVDEQEMTEKYTAVTLDDVDRKIQKNWSSLECVQMEDGTYYNGYAHFQKKGQEMWVSCANASDDEEAWDSKKLYVGILGPDHKITYIKGDAIENHAFEIQKEGMYRIFVVNKSGKKQEVALLYTHHKATEE